MAWTCKCPVNLEAAKEGNGQWDVHQQLKGNE